MQSQSDDDFGLSSSDEAELLKVESGPSLKRKHEEIYQGNGVKRSRFTNEASAGLTIANRILQHKFRLGSFRLKQQEAISCLLDGRSAAVVFPTGGGKSLCYQVPALCFKELDKLENVRQGRGQSGITLVVSPLIALMKDQVDGLKRLGLSAAVLNSATPKDEYLITMEAMRNGTLDILYCAPERLNNEGFVGLMAHVQGGVRLLAVDEAHCISEWGHAFRPDYLKVSRFAKEIEAERVVCLTATATPQVTKDVCHAFAVVESDLYRTSSYRQNLRLLAQSYQTKEESYPKLRAFLLAHLGPTIIYITTHLQSEKLAEQLRKHGFKARHFHAGMKNEEKVNCQEAFMAADDLIIVATIAFGMGIDKPNIRNVIHYDIPRSLESYSQEIGRAGRDGLESHCMLYLCAEDLHLRESFARGDLPSKRSVSALMHEIFSTPVVNTATGPVVEANIYQQSKDYDIRSTVVNNIYAQIELRFELLRATTPKYTSYSFKPVASTDQDKSLGALAVRNVQQKAKTWTHVDVEVAARSSGLPRADIVSKLNSWHDEQLIILQTGGVVNIYRVLKDMPTARHERQQIIDALYRELELREEQELQRMKQVIDLVTGSTCFARQLAQHFGDTLPGDVLECGHCTWCEKKMAVANVTPPPVPWDSRAFFNVLETIPDREDPRFLTRVAFGITSPRVTRSKLGAQKVFGSMEDHNFMTLLQAFTKICEKQ